MLTGALPGSEQRIRRLARPLPARRQPLQAAQHEGRPPFRIERVIQPQVRDPPEQGRDRDLGLDPRQLGAEAEMDASAKGQRPYIGPGDIKAFRVRSEEHTSELQSQSNLVCRLLLEKKKTHD